MQVKNFHLTIQKSNGVIISKEEPLENELLWAKENTYVKSGEEEKILQKGLLYLKKNYIGIIHMI